jgi:hypothetical protein
MADRQALPFNDVLTRLRDVEQQVDEVILQEVDLVDIEVSPVGAGQEAGFERLFAVGQRLFDVERADDAILGRPSGRSMTGVGFSTTEWSCTCAQSGTSFSEAEFTGQPATARIGGSSAANPRTAVDFPVPRSPNTRTPPIPGSMAVRIMARFISSWPTMAENGKGPVSVSLVILRLPRSDLSRVVRDGASGPV